jgi:hypothetical protein
LQDVNGLVPGTPRVSHPEVADLDGGSFVGDWKIGGWVEEVAQWD